MANRDPLDDLPSIAAEPVGGAAPARGAARQAGAVAASASAAPSPQRAASATIPLAVVLGLVIALGGWFAYVQNEQLTMAEAELAHSAKRIKRLEEELNITGSTLSETSEQTEEKISEQADATKRLQDVSSRNRDAINETRRVLGRTDKALEATTARASTLETQNAEQGKELEQLRAQLVRANEGIRSLAASNRELIDKVNAADQNARALRASLERRVRENEEAIAAVDKFRQQINRQLGNLGSDVAALKAAAAQGGG